MDIDGLSIEKESEFFPKIQGNSVKWVEMAKELCYNMHLRSIPGGFDWDEQTRA